MKSSAPRRIAVVMSAAAAVTVLAVPPVLASGGGGGGAASSGPCSTVSLWTLQAQTRGTQIAVRADVFTNQAFSTWTYKLLDNGVKVAKGTAVADKERRDLAYFEIRRSTRDQAGSDTFRFLATNTGTGEVCDGSLVV